MTERGDGFSVKSLVCIRFAAHGRQSMSRSESRTLADSSTARVVIVTESSRGASKMMQNVGLQFETQLEPLIGAPAIFLTLSVQKLAVGWVGKHVDSGCYGQLERSLFALLWWISGSWLLSVTKEGGDAERACRKTCQMLLLLLAIHDHKSSLSKSDVTLRSTETEAHLLTQAAKSCWIRSSFDWLRAWVPCGVTFSSSARALAKQSH